MSAAETEKFVAAEVDKLGKIIREAQIKPE